MTSLTLLLLLQDNPRPIEVPNAMGAHTWFIILAVGAFLAWSISYSLQLHKEALERKKGRAELSRQRDDLLDQIAELETQKEAESITDKKYKQELKELKFRLSKVIDRLGAKS